MLCWFHDRTRLLRSVTAIMIVLFLSGTMPLRAATTVVLTGRVTATQVITPRELQLAIDDLMVKLERDRAKGTRAQRDLRNETLARLARGSALLDIALAQTPAKRSELIRQLPSAARVLASDKAQGTVPSGPSGDVLESPDGSSESTTRAAKRSEDCEDEEGIAPCATEEELLDAEILSEELDVAVSEEEQAVQELQDFIDAYCIEFPSACSGSPEAASDSVSEAELDEAASEDSCSPEASVACLEDVTAAIMGVIAAKGEVAALWEASKQVMVITARKLGSRVFWAITGYGTAALLAALAADCIIYQLMQSEPVDLGPTRPRFLLGDLEAAPSS